MHITIKHTQVLGHHLLRQIMGKIPGWGSKGGRKENTLMGIKRFDHRTKVKAKSERQNLQTASQLCTKQVGTGEINQIIESLLKVKVQRITKTY